MNKYQFFNRDLSWLSFNERVLLEARDPDVPLMERFRFLSIYSSNLDEFYRVRVPAYNRKNATVPERQMLDQISATVRAQQNMFGETITRMLIPALKEKNIEFLYNKPIPEFLSDNITAHFFNRMAGHLHVVDLDADDTFFPANNKLYKCVVTASGFYVINIPSDKVSRFLHLTHESKSYTILIEDIISFKLDYILPGAVIAGDYNFKLTRDASLNIVENEAEDPADVIEKELSRRDKGKATRFLYDECMPEQDLHLLRKYLKLKKATLVAGSRYHHMKELSSLPLHLPGFEYKPFVALNGLPGNAGVALFDRIATQDILLHPPYQSYDAILRFFNEASLSRDVSEIYVTMYRIANDSGIAHALINASKNKKKVVVLVELKARFDEANNIRWSKAMKAAGVKIVYSENSLKVHAKIALVKQHGKDRPLMGLFSTGNFNEITSGIYTDHVLLTADQLLLAEMERLFAILIQGK
ncbi:MAG: polyphosphate kinase 1, partial [Chitinophagaceae bacterium]